MLQLQRRKPAQRTPNPKTCSPPPQTEFDYEYDLSELRNDINQHCSIQRIGTSCCWRELYFYRQLVRSKEMIIDHKRKTAQNQLIKTIMKTKAPLKLANPVKRRGLLFDHTLQERAGYGWQQLKLISKQLTQEYGKGFDITNLRNMCLFYIAFKKRETLFLELSWFHYNRLDA